MASPKSEAKLKDSLQHYGKQTLNEKEQIKILSLVLEDVKVKAQYNNKICDLIADFQLKLEKQDNLKKAARIANEFIVALEAQDHDGSIVNYLKTKGFYRILYRNPRLKGEELAQDDTLHQLLRAGFQGVAVSALIIVLFSATLFFAAPFWLTAIATGLFVGASTYLSGILYGVVNDLFATHANLPYFLLGHQPQQKTLLRTNDKVAQGIAWGVAATFGPVLLASVVFTIAATITAFIVPMATFLLPIMMVAMPLIAVGAEFYARNKTHEYIENNNIDHIHLYLNEYQLTGLKYMSPTQPELAAWLANSDRNMFGFTKVPLIGLGSLLGLVVLSSLNQLLPVILFASPMIAVAIPAAFAAVACATLVAAGIYTYTNRNTQVDDRYRLEFDRAEPEPNLYLDEDRDYVNGLIAKNFKNGTNITPSSAPTNLSANKAFFDKRSLGNSPKAEQDRPKSGNGQAFRLP